MVAITFRNFRGAAPRISPELLPPGVGEVSQNTKLYAGDLIPYRAPVNHGSGTQLISGGVKSMFALRDASDNPDWRSWSDDVSVVTPIPTEEQWYYFTGDGVPKYSNRNLRTASYNLGLPIPNTALTTTAGANPDRATSKVSRTGDRATLTFATDHGFLDRHIVTVKGFTGDNENFNVNNVEIKVEGKRVISYYNPSDDLAETTSTDGMVKLSGTPQIRTYVHTWITPLGEESIPSEPSTPNKSGGGRANLENEVVVEGQVVTVQNLPEPQDAPDSTYVRGIRVYRSISSAQGSGFFRVRTLWYPVNLTAIRRINDVAQVETEFPHNFIRGDRFTITGDVRVNGAHMVSKVINRNTFEFTDPGSNLSRTTSTSGVIYYDVAPESRDAVYWGLSNWLFDDTYDVFGISTPLNSDINSPPPEDLQGLALAHNNMMIGFFDKQLCVSRPGQFHAWPEQYRLTFEDDITAVAELDGAILVLTRGFPHQVNGNSPGNLIPIKIDTAYPCLSRRSVVNMGNSIMWATYAGLASWTPGRSISIPTEIVHSWDTWNELLNIEDVVGHYYERKYFGSYVTELGDRAGFVFDVINGGQYSTLGHGFSAAWTDRVQNRMYYTFGTQGTLYEWDSSHGDIAPMEWLSGPFVLRKPINFGAIRVVADYGAELDDDTEAQTDIATRNTELITPYLTGDIGAINGPLNPTTTTLQPEKITDNAGGLNSYEINGNPVFEQARIQGSTDQFSISVVFSLIPDSGDLTENTPIATRTISDSAIHKLPPGYKFDKYRVCISGYARVRYIQLGETPKDIEALSG